MVPGFSFHSKKVIIDFESQTVMMYVKKVDQGVSKADVYHLC